MRLAHHKDNTPYNGRVPNDGSRDSNLDLRGLWCGLCDSRVAIAQAQSPSSALSALRLLRIPAECAVSEGNTCILMICNLVADADCLAVARPARGGGVTMSG